MEDSWLPSYRRYWRARWTSCTWTSPRLTVSRRPGRWRSRRTVSVAGSLGADAILVVIGERVFPSTSGYVHFQFSDYARLTIIGVLIACAAWPIVTRISSAPRWLFFRMAIAVTLVLGPPDLWILHLGQPGQAVAVLMVMHLAIAVVTYNALVDIARVQPATYGSRPSSPARHAGRSS